MKRYLILLLAIAGTISVHAQILKKIKDKVKDKVEKTIDKPSGSEKKDDENSSDNKNGQPAAGGDNTADNEKGTPKIKYNSKFDFVPGSTIIYFDNFEKDNIGETPEGWITNTSAEVVTIDGLEGHWLKSGANYDKQIIRSKKQSWGNNFTVEFDFLIVSKNTPRLGISLFNTQGNLVTDPQNLKLDEGSSTKAILFWGILSQPSRATLYSDENKLSDINTEKLVFSNSAPVHVSICVQDKRYRLWWNNDKIYDLSAVDPEFIPNQLGFYFTDGGSEYFISNIRIAKDVPDSRVQFEQGKLVSNLLFYSGTATLKPESMGSLLDVSKVIKSAPSTVKIVGHTDSDGNEAANQKLSEQRAQTVKELLVSQFGIAADKMVTEGRGETQPLADNNSAEGKAQNRRVEFIFKEEADHYTKPAGLSSGNATAVKSSSTGSSAKSSTNIPDAPATVKLQSKIMNTSLPYAMFMKKGDNHFTFIASKEEGNDKENYFRIELESVNTRLKPETFNFKAINEKNPLYGTKKLAAISSTNAVLYYGPGKKPYIYAFTSIIADAPVAKYVDESLIEHFPPSSPNCKLVIDKVENGKASGYFTMGIMIQGLKAVTKGDAEEKTFTTGFAGELKCTFSNVPVY